MITNIETYKANDEDDWKDQYRLLIASDSLYFRFQEHSTYTLQFYSVFGDIWQSMFQTFDLLSIARKLHKRGLSISDVSIVYFDGK